MTLELIAKEPTELEKLEKRVESLEAKVQRIDIELKQVKVKKKPSIGFFRARFK